MNSVTLLVDEPNDYTERYCSKDTNPPSFSIILINKETNRAIHLPTIPEYTHGFQIVINSSQWIFTNNWFAYMIFISSPIWYGYEYGVSPFLRTRLISSRINLVSGIPISECDYILFKDPACFCFHFNCVSNSHDLITLHCDWYCFHIVILCVQVFLR